MHILSYLQRINVRDVGLMPDKDTLFRLHHAHIFHIPFENLDIQWGIPISLDARRFHDKIVENTRGGYCYELNGLFYELLQHKGFEVMMVSARVFNGKRVGREFDHLALLVTIDGGQWLTDVGFGDFSLQPLLMTEEVQTDGRNHYRIGHMELEGTMYHTAEKWNAARSEFVPEYVFTAIPRRLSDFSEMNQYQQTDPQSHFVQNLMCSLPVADGRISMINNRMVLTRGGQRTEQPIADERQRAALLQEYFGIQHALLVK